MKDNITINITTGFKWLIGIMILIAVWPLVISLISGIISLVLLALLLVGVCFVLGAVVNGIKRWLAGRNNRDGTICL